MSPHWQTYAVVIGAWIVLCITVALVADWRAEKARRAHVQRLTADLPRIDAAAELAAFGDVMRREVERERFERLIHPSAGNGLADLDSRSHP